jgi:hypothetical protein
MESLRWNRATLLTLVSIIRRASLCIALAILKLPLILQNRPPTAAMARINNAGVFSVM